MLSFDKTTRRYKLNLKQFAAAVWPELSEAEQARLIFLQQHEISTDTPTPDWVFAFSEDGFTVDGTYNEPVEYVELSLRIDPDGRVTYNPEQPNA